jgi:hypothetical protein
MRMLVVDLILPIIHDLQKEEGREEGKRIEGCIKMCESAFFEVKLFFLFCNEYTVKSVRGDIECLSTYSNF